MSKWIVYVVDDDYNNARFLFLDEESDEMLLTSELNEAQAFSYTRATSYKNYLAKEYDVKVGVVDFHQLLRLYNGKSITKRSTIDVKRNDRLWNSLRNKISSMS